MTSWTSHTVSSQEGIKKIVYFKKPIKAVNRKRGEGNRQEGHTSKFTTPRDPSQWSISERIHRSERSVTAFTRKHTGFLLASFFLQILWELTWHIISLGGAQRVDDTVTARSSDWYETHYRINAQLENLYDTLFSWWRPRDWRKNPEKTHKDTIDNDNSPPTPHTTPAAAAVASPQA